MQTACRDSMQIARRAEPRADLVGMQRSRPSRIAKGI